jgi:hypothetical protein
MEHHIPSKLNQRNGLPADQPTNQSTFTWQVSKDGKHGRSAPINTPPAVGMLKTSISRMGETRSVRQQLSSRIGAGKNAKRTNNQPANKEEPRKSDPVVQGGSAPQKSTSIHQLLPLIGNSSGKHQQTRQLSCNLPEVDRLTRTEHRTPGSQGPSYASFFQKVRKIAPTSKQLSVMVRPKPIPMKFERIHLVLENARMLKGKSTAVRNRITKCLLKYLGIKNKVTLWSLIGNSIVELYVPEASIDTVLENIELKDGTALRNPDIWIKPDYMEWDKFEKSTLARVNWQTKQSKYINLTECIRQGMPEAFNLLDDHMDEMISNRKSVLPSVETKNLSQETVTPVLSKIAGENLDEQNQLIGHQAQPSNNMDVTMEQSEEPSETDGPDGRLNTELASVVERATAPTQC